jgi:hypothetical protein
MQKLKKTTDWSILHIKDYNVDHLVRYSASLNSEWFYDTSRQQTYKTHKDTQMFPIRFMDYEWNPGDPITILNKNNIIDIEAKEQLDSIINDLEKDYESKVVRIEFVRMPAQTSVRPHVDGGDMLYLIRRCHLPMVTHEDVLFTVLDNTINMKVGSAYEINNGMPHSVINKSGIDRIHLIIDLLPNEHF